MTCAATSCARLCTSHCACRGPSALCLLGLLVSWVLAGLFPGLGSLGWGVWGDEELGLGPVRGPWLSEGVGQPGAQKRRPN